MHTPPFCNAASSFETEQLSYILHEFVFGIGSTAPYDCTLCSRAPVCHPPAAHSAHAKAKYRENPPLGNIIVCIRFAAVLIVSSGMFCIPWRNYWRWWWWWWFCWFIVFHPAYSSNWKLMCLTREWRWIWRTAISYLLLQYYSFFVVACTLLLHNVHKDLSICNKGWSLRTCARYIVYTARTMQAKFWMNSTSYRV